MQLRMRGSLNTTLLQRAESEPSNRPIDWNDPDFDCSQQSKPFEARIGLLAVILPPVYPQCR